MYNESESSCEFCSHLLYAFKYQTFMNCINIQSLAHVTDEHDEQEQEVFFVAMDKVSSAYDIMETNQHESVVESASTAWNNPLTSTCKFNDLYSSFVRLKTPHLATIKSPGL